MKRPLFKFHLKPLDSGAMRGRGRLGAGVALTLAFLAWGGGSVYRTTCPLPSGAVETSWGTGILDALPYARDTAALCEGHTVTRLLMSAVGIARIDPAPSPAAIAADRAFVTEASSVLDAMSAEWAMENETERTLRTMPAAKRLAHVLGVLRAGRSVYSRLADRLDAAPSPADSDLAALETSLTKWLRIQVALDDLYIRGLDEGTINNPAVRESRQRLGDDLARVRTELIELQPSIQLAYPRLNEWIFLASQS